MTETKQEYANRAESYNSIEGKPVFAVGDMVIIPDIPTACHVYGGAVYGRCRHHIAGEPVEIRKVSRYRSRYGMYTYQVYVRGCGWYYLECDLVTINKQMELFNLDKEIQ